MEKQIVLLAGGTGLIGGELKKFLEKSGHEVRILSRKPSDQGKNRFHWDPSKKEMDRAALEKVTTIINLSGAGIADKRWTKNRKKELVDSRVLPALFLASFAPEMKELQQYISASGINCYGYDPDKVYTEDDPFGMDFLSQVVLKWEEAADAFLPFCTVSKIRISMVLSEKGGALPTMVKPVKLGFAAAIGSGKQWTPWIHIHDLARVFCFAMEKRLAGSFNASAKTVTNEQLMSGIAKQLHKKMWMPNVPALALKLVLGEMSMLILQGLNASNQKLKNNGFAFHFENLESTLKEIYD